MSIEENGYKDKVSVVIPYFNRSSTIENTLISVLEQSFKPTEIIIVDDKSNSEDIIKLNGIISKFNDYGVTIRVYSSNVKLFGSKARNIGMELATGNVIALLDSDDEWIKNHLEHSIGILSSNEIDFCYSSHNIFDGNNIVKTRSRQFDKENERPIDFVLSSCMPQTSSFVFYKSVFELGLLKFDEDLKRHQDLQFLEQALNYIKCKYTGKHTTIVNWIRGEKRNIDFKSCQYYVEKYEGIVNRKVYFNYLIKMQTIALSQKDHFSVSYYNKKAREFADSRMDKLLSFNPYITKFIYSSYETLRKIF